MQSADERSDVFHAQRQGAGCYPVQALQRVMAYRCRNVHRHSETCRMNFPHTAAADETRPLVEGDKPHGRRIACKAPYTRVLA